MMIKYDGEIRVRKRKVRREGNEGLSEKNVMEKCIVKRDGKEKISTKERKGRERNTS